MAKKKSELNVVPFSRRASSKDLSFEEKLQLAEKSVVPFFKETGSMEWPDERIPLYRKAIAAGKAALGDNWETEFKGLFWVAHETRPLMHAMVKLAIDLQEEGERDEALALYRELMTINPNDNQGVRYLLANCLYAANCGKELEALLKEYDDDTSADFLYTKALHLFRKSNGGKLAEKALRKAFSENVYVPIFLSDVVEMPDESPERIGIGDESEAIAYAMDHGDLWYDTDGATAWMANTLSSEIQEICKEDPELVELVLKDLRCEWDD